MDQAGLSLAEYRILGNLCRRADKISGMAWPKWETVADDCGVSRATVSRCLTVLEERGFIKNCGKPFGGSTRYQITPPKVSPEELLDHNSITAGIIDDGPIVSPESANSIPGDTPIVSPETLEGTPRKKHQLKNSKEGALVVEFPPNLSSESFRQAWNDWLIHRKEIKKKVTATSAAKLLAKIATWGESRAIAAIEHSIASGWQGVFEPKTIRTTTPTTPTPTGSLGGDYVRIRREAKAASECPEPEPHNIKIIS